MNAKDEARSWTDHLVRHQFAPTVNFLPIKPLKSREQMRLTVRTTRTMGLPWIDPLEYRIQCNMHAVSLTFYNDCPLEPSFATLPTVPLYVARYSGLFNGKDEQINASGVAVSMNEIELQDRVHRRNPQKPRT